MPNTKSAIRRVKRTKLQTSINRIRKNKNKSVVLSFSGISGYGKQNKSISLEDRIKALE